MSPDPVSVGWRKGRNGKIRKRLRGLPPGVDVLKRCLFCRKRFPKTERFGRFRSGRRIAYDPVRGRLWAVCDRCHRWNLAPLEERGENLYQLEKLCRNRATGELRNVAILLFEAPVRQHGLPRGRSDLRGGGIRGRSPRARGARPGHHVG